MSFIILKYKILRYKGFSILGELQNLWQEFWWKASFYTDKAVLVDWEGIYDTPDKSDGYSQSNPYKVYYSKVEVGFSRLGI